MSEFLKSLPLVVGVVVAGIGFGLLLRSQHLVSVDGPRLLIEDNALDLGLVWNQQRVSHRIPLMNSGNMPLAVSVTKISCDCTSAILSTESIAPQQRGFLDVVIEAPYQPGPFSVTVGLQSNSQTSPSSLVSIRGVSRPYLELDSPMVNLRYLDQVALPTEGIIAFAPGSDVPNFALSQLAFRSSADYVSASSKVVNGEYFIVVQIHETAPLGVVEEVVEISLTPVPKFSILVPVLAQIDGRISSNPASIFFGEIAPNIPTSRSIQLIGITEDEVISARLEPDWLGERAEIGITKLHDGVVEVTLELTLPPSNSSGKGLIVIRVENPINGENTLLHIPVVANKPSRG